MSMEQKLWELHKEYLSTLLRHRCEELRHCQSDPSYKEVVQDDGWIYVDDPETFFTDRFRGRYAEEELAHVETFSSIYGLLLRDPVPISEPNLFLLLSPLVSRGERACVSLGLALHGMCKGCGSFTSTHIDCSCKRGAITTLCSMHCAVVCISAKALLTSMRAHSLLPLSCIEGSQRETQVTTFLTILAEVFLACLPSSSSLPSLSSLCEYWRGRQLYLFLEGVEGLLALTTSTGVTHADNNLPSNPSAVLCELVDAVSKLGIGYIHTLLVSMEERVTNRLLSGTSLLILVRATALMFTSVADNSHPSLTVELSRTFWKRATVLRLVSAPRSLLPSITKGLVVTYEKHTPSSLLSPQLRCLLTQYPHCVSANRDLLHCFARLSEFNPTVPHLSEVTLTSQRLTLPMLQVLESFILSNACELRALLISSLPTSHVTSLVQPCLLAYCAVAVELMEGEVSKGAPLTPSSCVTHASVIWSQLIVSSGTSFPSSVQLEKALRVAIRDLLACGIIRIDAQQGSNYTTHEEEEEESHLYILSYPQRVLCATALISSPLLPVSEWMRSSWRQVMSLLVQMQGLAFVWERVLAQRIFTSEACTSSSLPPSLSEYLASFSQDGFDTQHDMGQLCASVLLQGVLLLPSQQSPDSKEGSVLSLLKDTLFSRHRPASFLFHLLHLHYHELSEVWGNESTLWRQVLSDVFWIHEQFPPLRAYAEQSLIRLCECGWLHEEHLQSFLALLTSDQERQRSLAHRILVVLPDASLCYVRTQLPTLLLHCYDVEPDTFRLLLPFLHRLYAHLLSVSLPRDSCLKGLLEVCVCEKEDTSHTCIHCSSCYSVSLSPSHLRQCIPHLYEERYLPLRELLGHNDPRTQLLALFVLDSLTEQEVEVKDQQVDLFQVMHECGLGTECVGSMQVIARVKQLLIHMMCCSQPVTSSLPSSFIHLAANMSGTPVNEEFIDVFPSHYLSSLVRMQGSPLFALLALTHTALHVNLKSQQLCMMLDHSTVVCREASIYVLSLTLAHGNTLVEPISIIPSLLHTLLIQYDTNPGNMEHPFNLLCTLFTHMLPTTVPPKEVVCAWVEATLSHPTILLPTLPHLLPSSRTSLLGQLLATLRVRKDCGGFPYPSLFHVCLQTRDSSLLLQCLEEMYLWITCTVDLGLALDSVCAIQSIVIEYFTLEKHTRSSQLVNACELSLLHLTSSLSLQSSSSFLSSISMLAASVAILMEYVTEKETTKEIKKETEEETEEDIETLLPSCVLSWLPTTLSPTPKQLTCGVLFSRNIILTCDRMGMREKRVQSRLILVCATWLLHNSKLAHQETREMALSCLPLLVGKRLGHKLMTEIRDVVVSTCCQTTVCRSEIPTAYLPPILLQLLSTLGEAEGMQGAHISHTLKWVCASLQRKDFILAATSSGLHSSLDWHLLWYKMTALLSSPYLPVRRGAWKLCVILSHDTTLRQEVSSPLVASETWQAIMAHMRLTLHDYLHVPSIFSSSSTLVVKHRAHAATFRAFLYKQARRFPLSILASSAVLQSSALFLLTDEREPAPIQYRALVYLNECAPSMLCVSHAPVIVSILTHEKNPEVSFKAMKYLMKQHKSQGSSLPHFHVSPLLYLLPCILSLLPRELASLRQALAKWLLPPSDFVLIWSSPSEYAQQLLGLMGDVNAAVRQYTIRSLGTFFVKGVSELSELSKGSKDTIDVIAIAMLSRWIEALKDKQANVRRAVLPWLLAVPPSLHDYVLSNVCIPQLYSAAAAVSTTHLSVEVGVKYARELARIHLCHKLCEAWCLTIAHRLLQLYK